MRFCQHVPGRKLAWQAPKAFTAQLTVLFALAVDFGRAKAQLTEAECAELQQKLLSVPGAVGAAIETFDPIRPIAQHLKKAPSCLFLGRAAYIRLPLKRP